MSYRLKFLSSALKEWHKLAPPVCGQFKNKLAQRLENPRISASQLRGIKNAYKIKLRASGYRLVYEVSDEEITVYVVAVGKRERGEVYARARGRL